MLDAKNINLELHRGDCSKTVGLYLKHHSEEMMLNCKPSRNQCRKLGEKKASYRLNSQKNDAPVCSERKGSRHVGLKKQYYEQSC